MLSKHTSVVLDTKLHMWCIYLILKYFIDIVGTIEYNFKRYLPEEKKAHKSLTLVKLH